MLAKEKRLAIKSIAVGVVATGLVAGFYSWQVRQADARLDALRNAPTAKATPKAGDFVPDAELLKPGEALTPISPGGHWESVDSLDIETTDAEATANQARDNRWFLSLLTFVAFALPLVWYFLLDRLREISAALSGRDKSN